MKEFIVRQLIAFLKPFRQPFFAIFDLITFKFQSYHIYYLPIPYLKATNPSFWLRPKYLLHSGFACVNFKIRKKGTNKCLKVKIY